MHSTRRAGHRRLPVLRSPYPSTASVRIGGLAGGVYIATVTPEGYAEVTCPGVRVVGQSRQLEIRLMPKDGPEPSSCKVVEAAG